MPQFKSLYGKGINQDSSKEAYPQGAYFDLSCGRLLNDSDLSNGAISTIKGNDHILPGNLSVTFPTKAELSANSAGGGDKQFFTAEAIEDGTARSTYFGDIKTRIDSTLNDWDECYPIGSCSINNDIIIFTRLIDSVGGAESLGIWKLTTSPRGSTSRFDIKGKRYYLNIIYISTIDEVYWKNNEVKIDAVGYYETDRIQNIYWLDEYNSLRKLNIAEPEVFIKSSALLDVIPEAKITPPDFVDINSNGQLQVGHIQYAYRYYIPNGQQTFFSLPSPLIHLTDSDEKSGDAGRYYRGSNRLVTTIDEDNIIETVEPKSANKSVTVQIKDLDTNYEYVELISIYYSQLNSDPVITSIYQGKFTGSEFTFTDFGSTVLNTYTLAEYRLFNIDFIPKTLAIKDNILFVGNITEKFYNSDAWESFETRAFRFDSSGIMRIYKDFSEDTAYDTDDQLIVGLLGSTFSDVRRIDGGLVTSGSPIEDYQDYNSCNRFNNLDLVPNQSTPGNYGFMYQSDGTTVGGEGPNVKYKFTNKELIIDERIYTPGTTAPFTTAYLAYDSLSGIPTSHIIDTKANKDELGIGPSSYSSPYNSAYYKQYKRNEIYRFALVVFDKKGVPSKPKWIGDIRTPVMGTNGIGGTTNNDFEIVELSGGTSTSDPVISTANALGIDFNIDFNGSDVEDEIQGYAIVRCERGVDRINLGQGLLNTLRSFTTAGASKEGGAGAGDQGKICKSFDGVKANINSLYVYSGVIDPAVNSNWDYRDYTNYEWISPEASFNDNLKLFNDSFVQPVGVVERVGNAVNFDLMTHVRWLNTTTGENWLPSVALDTCQLSKTVISNPTSYLYVGKQFISSFSSIYSDFGGTPTLYTDLLTKNSNVEDGALISSGGTYFSNQNDFVAWSSSTGGDIYNLNAKSFYMRLDDIPLNTLNATDGTYLILSDYVRATIPYGGVETTARELNTYQFCDNYISIDEHTDNQYFSAYTVTRGLNNTTITLGKTVFGGDTFINLYQHIKVTLPKSESDKSVAVTGNPLSYTNLITFPCESTVNTNLRHDSYIPTYSDEYNINLFAEARQAANPGTTCYTGGIIQLEDLYLYNTVFSKSDSTYISQSVATNENLGREFTSRVLASQKKFLGEFADSWTKFGANEFLDLDTVSGELTRLITHRDHVYAFQNDGISRLAVNEKSTVQDDTGQSIVLGTGGVLPYSTYITKNSGTLHKWSVVSTPETIYYYDRNNNTINYISNANGGISDIKGLFSYFSDINFNIASSGNDLLVGVDSVYNHKYREAEMAFQFTIDGVSDISNQAFVIRLNDKIKAFTSITNLNGSNYSVPFMYFPGNQITLSTPRADGYLPTEELYVEDVGDQNTFYDFYNPLKLTLVVNPFKDRTTILDSIEFNSRVEDPSVSDIFDKIIQDETITSIRAYDDLHDTGTINLTTNTARGRRWIVRKVRQWRYNYFRDTRSTNQRDSRLRNYYFIIELTFDSSVLPSSPSVPRYFELGNINSYLRDIRTTQL